MTRNASLLARAKGLSPEERFPLVHAPLEALDRPDPTIEEAWAVEAKRRLAAMECGSMPSPPFAWVFSEHRP